MAKVIAYEYDNATTGSDAPVTFAVVPGEWTPGQPVLPAAFGLTVEQMRAAIKDFGLPIREVKVEEKDATAELHRGFNHLPTDEGFTVTPMPSQAVIETDAGPIPAAVTRGATLKLNPLAAAHTARNTVLSNGGSMEEAAAAAREAGGDYGEAIAARTERAAAAAGATVGTEGDPAGAAEEAEPGEDI